MSDDSVICDERSALLKREEDIPTSRISEPRYTKDDPPPEGDATVCVVILDRLHKVLGWDAILRDPRPIWVDGEPGLEFLIPMSIYIRNPGAPAFYAIMGVDDRGRCGIFTDDPVPLGTTERMSLHRGDAVTFAEPIRVRLHRAPIEHVASPPPMPMARGDLFVVDDSH